jgi:hypothetical protein
MRPDLRVQSCQLLAGACDFFGAIDNPDHLYRRLAARSCSLWRLSAVLPGTLGGRGFGAGLSMFLVRTHRDPREARRSSADPANDVHHTA